MARCKNSWNHDTAWELRLCWQK